MREKKRTSLDVDEALWLRAKKEALERGTSFGHYVETVIRNHLAQSGKLPVAPARDTLDISDLDAERQKYARQFVAALRGPNYHKLRLALPGLLHFATSAGKEE